MPGRPLPHSERPAGSTCAMSLGPMTDEERSAVQTFREYLKERKAAGYTCAGMNMKVTSETLDGVLVLHVSGDIDVYNAPKLRELTIQAVSDGCYRFVLDLAEASYIDTTGLGVLVGAHKRVRAHGGWLVLAGLNQTNRDLFQQTELDKVFPIGENVEEALAAGEAL